MRYEMTENILALFGDHMYLTDSLEDAIKYIEDFGVTPEGGKIYYLMPLAEVKDGGVIDLTKQGKGFSELRSDVKNFK